jgi:hypothetical protein
MKQTHSITMLLSILLLLLLIATTPKPNHADTTTTTTTSLLSFPVSIKARPPMDDAYCLGGAAIPSYAKNKRVKGFVPLVGSAAHHIMLFSCSNELDDTTVFHGDACSAGHDHHESPCDNGRIVYVWAHGGNPLYYPPGVGLVLGGETGGVHSFRVQVHFGNAVTAPDEYDLSGVRVVLEDDTEIASSDSITTTTTTKKTWSEAEIYLLVPNLQWSLPPQKPEILIEQKGHPWRFPFTVFAVRVHAHSRAEWNRVIVHRKGTDGSLTDDVWTFKRSTKLPQSFFPLESFFTILPGDSLDFGCMYNTMQETRYIQQGATKKDEMCNIYLYGFKPSLEAIKNEQLQQQQQQDSITNNNKKTTLTIEILTTLPHNEQVVGVDVDELSHLIWTFSRGPSRIWTRTTFNSQHIVNDKTLIPHPVLVAYDVTSKTEKIRVGANLFHLPHSVRVDPIDAGHVWVADVGLHQVLKINTITNKIVASFGEKFVPKSDDTGLCQPTDVAFSRDASSIFISDGYCNNRIIELRRSDLVFLKSYTIEGLDLPHTLTTIQCTDVDYLLVASRESPEIMVFDITKREFLSQSLISHIFHIWEADWMPYGLNIMPKSNRLVIGLVKRDGDQRTGKLWVGSENICIKLTPTSSNLRGQSPVVGQYAVVKSGTPPLLEPHLITSTIDGIYFSECVDGQHVGYVRWVGV